MNTSRHQVHRPGWFSSRNLTVAGAMILLPLIAACSSNSSDSSSTPVAGPATGVSGSVVGLAGEVIAGATVYLVPTDKIDYTPITGANILSRVAEDFDEPLEDTVRLSGATLPQVVTDAAGSWTIDPVDDGRYFVFVEPPAGDAEHLPGGSECRESYLAEDLKGQNLAITMTSSAPANATYVGMSQCLTCHPEYNSYKQVAMRLGFRKPGISSPLQDTSYHPELDEGLAAWTEGADYTAGTPVYFYDFDPTRGFDKFKTSLTDPTGDGGVVAAKLWMWRDTADNKYKLTFENVGNPADPMNLMEREVKLTYGGAVNKQRYMIAWPGLNGLYPVLQYQTYGSDGIYERTRHQYRDYHLDFYWDQSGTPTDVSDDVFKAPSITKNIQVNCMGCHATGYEQYVDGVTGERLCDTVEDPNGEYDIDGDGFINDLNTGCESCHGPGSEHVAQNGAEGRYILEPDLMTASRELMLCGRCHDRQEGHGTVENDHPLNEFDEFPLPGISRQEFLPEYTTRPGPKASSYWADFEHSKSHHQQAPDMVRSMHNRNPYELVACSSCHDLHGPTGDAPRTLIADPDEPDSMLCMQCHQEFIGSTAEHTAEVLGVPHGSFVASCRDCHMVQAAKSGSGEYGNLMADPTGADADADTTYFQNDISSHYMDVPHKANVGVLGVQPGKAMPVPYTNRCGTCHDPSTLSF